MRTNIRLLPNTTATHDSPHNRIATDIKVRRRYDRLTFVITRYIALTPKGGRGHTRTSVTERLLYCVDRLIPEKRNPTACYASPKGIREYANGSDGEMTTTNNVGLTLNEVHKGDCLTLMKEIPTGSLDMILCDLPYGTTANAWDAIIPFDSLWEQYERIIKDNGAIVLTASQPFSSALVASNIKAFKHEWIWEKERGTGFQVAKYRPMQKHEHVLIFAKGGKRVNYYPIKIKLDKPIKSKSASTRSGSSPLANVGSFDIVYTDRHPLSILEFSRDNANKVHPTQKPVALFEYLIKTYTNEGDVVLDNCLGSGTTAVAAINTNRNFIGIEREPEYVAISQRRIDEALAVKANV